MTFKQLDNFLNKEEEKNYEIVINDFMLTDDYIHINSENDLINISEYYININRDCQYIYNGELHNGFIFGYKYHHYLIASCSEDIVIALKPQNVVISR